ncbi:hypothetical protein SPFM12_00014 [Salmonella phage SPFM12]|nr:hypothetical protein SPFM12_00014 [Salmonella phage SPFM12]
MADKFEFTYNLLMNQNTKPLNIMFNRSRLGGIVKKSDTAKKRSAIEYPPSLFVMIKACLDNNLQQMLNTSFFGVSYEKQLATVEMVQAADITPRVRDLSILSLFESVTGHTEYLFPRNIAEFDVKALRLQQMLEQQLGLPAEQIKALAALFSVGQFYNHVEDSKWVSDAITHTFALAPYQSGRSNGKLAALMAQMPYHHEIFRNPVEHALRLDQARWELVWKDVYVYAATFTTLDKTNELKIHYVVETADVKPFPLPIVIGDKADLELARKLNQTVAQSDEVMALENAYSGNPFNALDLTRTHGTSPYIRLKDLMVILRIILRVILPTLLVIQRRAVSWNKSGEDQRLMNCVTRRGTHKLGDRQCIIPG